MIAKKMASKIVVGIMISDLSIDMPELQLPNQLISRPRLIMALAMETITKATTADTAISVIQAKNLVIIEVPF